MAQDMAAVASISETLRRAEDGGSTYGQALIATVTNKRTYEAWASTLDSVESAKLARIEKRVFAMLGMVAAPKGLKEWKAFVAAVITRYVAILDNQGRPSLLKGAHRRHADYLASIVIASNCGTCGPRDKAACGSCYPADEQGNALVSEPVGNPWGPCGPCDGTDAPMAAKAHPCQLMNATVVEPVTDRVDAYARRHHVEAEPIRQAMAQTLAEEVTPEDLVFIADFAAAKAADAADRRAAMDVVLNTVEGFSGALHAGAVTIPELVALGATRYAVSRAVKRGWVRPYGDAEPDRLVKGVYLTSEGIAERDRRQAVVSVPSVGDQSVTPTRVTTVTAAVKLACRPRVPGFKRRKPSCTRKGWK